MLMQVTAQQVKSLRDKTGVSIMAVKNALEEAKGDEDKAIEILRKRGEAKSGEKADREVREGVIAMKIEGKKGVLAMLRCETDFVARNQDFIALAQKIADRYFLEGEGSKIGSEADGASAVNSLGENIQIGRWAEVEAPIVAGYVHSNRKIAVLIGLDGGSLDQARDVAMHSAAMNPKVKYPEEISDELVVKEKEIWTEQLSKEGKAADKIPMILLGKEKKFREENALATQMFVKDPSKTVGQFLGDAKIIHSVRMAV